MTSAQKSNLNIVFGAMTIGKPGVEQTRVHDHASAAAILDVFQAHGHTDIDTARVYGEGSSEEYLGDLEWQKRGLRMHTKFYPTIAFDFTQDSWTHSPEHLRENLLRSLKALKAEKLDMWYLHGPDRSTPFKETLAEVDKLHREGYFERWGVSNYMAWEVAQICELCEQHGWVKPSVYQGIYNTLFRAVEPELFPCLRRYNMSFYAFNPLAGGFLTSRYNRATASDAIEPGSRFDAARWQGRAYRGRYWNDAFFDALDAVRATAQAHGLTEAECALRWMTHHSLLRKEHGDAVIIGASSTRHLESNLTDLEKGPLPEEVVAAMNGAWERVRGQAWKYWH